MSTFRGFHTPTYTPVPDQLFDELMADLSGAELKVLLYIMRRTFGFKKGSDCISMSQLQNGIQKKNGDTLDNGTGLSRRSIQVAVQSLVDKNILLKYRHSSDQKGHETTEFALNVIGNDPGLKSSQGGRAVSSQGLGYKVATQETVEQDTENVERLRSNVSQNPQELGEDAEPLRQSSVVDRPLSPAAKAAYQAYPKAIATGRIQTLDAIAPPRKGNAAAEGLDEQQIGIAFGLADEIAEILGSHRQNAGYYRTLSFHAVKHRYLPLVRQCLAETRAGDVPRGTVSNRPGYFTRVLQTKAKAEGVTLPMKAATRPRR